MKQWIPTLILAVVVAIGVGAMGMTAKSGFDARDEKISSLTDETDGLLARVGELEKDKALLAQELAELRAAKVVVRLPDNFEEMVDGKIQQAFEESSSMNKSLDTMISSKTEGMYDVVAQLLNDQVDELKDREQADRDAAAEQRRQQYAEWQARREQAELDSLAEELSLDELQKEDVGAVMKAMRQRTMEAFAEMRESGKFNVGEVMESLRDENNAAMAEVLSEEQLTAYKERQEREVGWLFQMMGRRNRQNQDQQNGEQ